MLETKAVFSRKEPDFEPRPCVVEKVIQLSSAEYDSFTRDMLRDRDFIRDNPIDIVIDAEGRYHCLLITGDGRRDGILVNPEGGDYARYSAFIPNAEDFLTMNRYPAIAALNQRLIGIVDDIARQIEAVPFGERSEVDLRDLETRHGIDLLTNGVLRDAVLDMLADRLDAPDFELDKNELIIHPSPDRVIPNEKPSVVEQIKAARQAPRQPDKDATQKHKNKGGPEL